MAATKIETLLEHVTELSTHLKNAKADLKTAIESTDVYDKLLRATLKQSTSTGCEIPDKAAKAHAFKVALAHFSPKKEPAAGSE
jgi:hypothetical protein